VRPLITSTDDGGSDKGRGESASGTSPDEFVAATRGAAPPRPWLAPSGSGSRPGGGDRSSAGAADAAPDEPAVRAVADGAGNASGGAAEPALEAVVGQVRGKLAGLAADPDAFHAALTESFGERHDEGAAEAIRQRTLAGDFSWMPKIELVDGSSLADTSGTQASGEGLGAYSAETDTVYLSRALVADDPAKAVSVLTEEIGHGLDARLNVADSAGDEGEIFSRLVDGENLTDAELQTLKAENDTGTIVVDGKEVAVEYNFLKKAVKGFGKLARKAVGVVTKPLEKAVDHVTDRVEQVVDSFKKVWKTVLESELLGQIMAVAQYIPIPIVSGIATIYNTVRAGHMVYRGLRDGSVATVLGGVAGLAGGAARLGPAFGASDKFVGTATRIATRANQASKLYSARSDLSFRSAVTIGTSLFGETRAAPFLRAADRGIRANDALQRGDTLGALAYGANAFAELPGTRHDAALDKVATVALDGRKVVALGRDDDYAAAISLVNDRYGTTLGLDAEGRAKVDEFVEVLDVAQTARTLVRENGDYFGAAAVLFDEGAVRFDSPVVRSRFASGAATFERLGTIRDHLDAGRLESAAEGTFELLEKPLDARTRDDLLNVLGRIDTFTGTARREPRAVASA